MAVLHTSITGPRLGVRGIPAVRGGPAAVRERRADPGAPGAAALGRRPRLPGLAPARLAALSAWATLVWLNLMPEVGFGEQTLGWVGIRPWGLGLFLQVPTPERQAQQRSSAGSDYLAATRLAAVPAGVAGLRCMLGCKGISGR